MKIFLLINTLYSCIKPSLSDCYLWRFWLPNSPMISYRKTHFLLQWKRKWEQTLIMVISYLVTRCEFVGTKFTCFSFRSYYRFLVINNPNWGDKNPLSKSTFFIIINANSKHVIVSFLIRESFSKNWQCSITTNWYKCVKVADCNFWSHRAPLEK